MWTDVDGGFGSLLAMASAQFALLRYALSLSALTLLQIHMDRSTLLKKIHMWLAFLNQNLHKGGIDCVLCSAEPELAVHLFL